MIFSRFYGKIPQTGNPEGGIIVESEIGDNDKFPDTSFSRKCAGKLLIEAQSKSPAFSKAAVS